MRRLQDERGATVVLVLFMLVVLIGILALAIDGGLLFAKYRQVRRASDASALAAAISCGTHELPDPTAKAIENAGKYSAANVDPSGPAALPPTVTFKDFKGKPVSPQTCTGMSAGRVTVRYSVQQPLIFGPAVGMTPTKPVSASATAIWGAAGSASNLAPLMLSMGLSDCKTIPNITPPKTCHFWWHKDLLGQATWAILNLSTWGVAPGAGCTQSGANLVSAVTDGWPSTLSLKTNPSYVCAMTGAHDDVTNKINDLIPRLFLFPVNDPTKQVAASGALCPSTSTGCTVDKYAIVGFAELRVTHLEKGKDAETLCGMKSPGSQGNFFCLEATWLGWNTEGYSPGEGTNFGTIAVTLGE